MKSMRMGMRLMVRMELAKYTLAVSSSFSATPGVFHKSIREVAVGKENIKTENYVVLCCWWGHLGCPC